MTPPTWLDAKTRAPARRMDTTREWVQTRDSFVRDVEAVDARSRPQRMSGPAREKTIDSSRPRLCLRSRWTTVAIVASLLVAGCAPPLKPVRSVGVHADLEEQYTLGQPAVAQVGEALVRRRDYLVRRGPGLRPSGAFRITGGAANFKVDASGSSTALYEVMGTTEWEGKPALVMVMPDIPVGFLVNEAGRFLGRATLSASYDGPDWTRDGPDWTRATRYHWECCNAYDYTIAPADTIFQVAEGKDTPVALRPGFNVDLIYAGRSPGELRLRYQEYAGTDLIKPVLSQELLYEIRTPLIRFFDLRIQVLEVSDDGIRYVVTQPPRELYRAPDLPDSDIATFEGASEVDGMPTAPLTKTRLAPGPHAIRYVASVVVYGGSVRLMHGTVVFTAQTGHAYVVKARAFVRAPVYVWIEDTTNGRVVHGTRPSAVGTRD